MSGFLFFREVKLVEDKLKDRLKGFRLKAEGIPNSLQPKQPIPPSIPYDADYFERGIQSGKSCFENYRWIVELTIPMAMVIIDYLGIKRGETILDYGCAKGYLVKALRWLGRDAWGYDISQYAIDHADPEIKNYVSAYHNGHEAAKYIIMKDILEHLNESDIIRLLRSIKSDTIFAVIPLGDGEKFNIPQFEQDITHVTRQTESWWCQIFRHGGWVITDTTNRIPGIKDHWSHVKDGHIFITAKRGQNE